MSIIRDAGFFVGGFAASWVAKPYIVKAYQGTATWRANRKAKKVEADKVAVKEGKEVQKDSVVLEAKALGNAIKTFFVDRVSKGNGTDVVEVHVDDGEVVKMTSAELAELLDRKEEAETSKEDLPVLK